jgi:hypothetical protein
MSCSSPVIAHTLDFSRAARKSRRMPLLTLCREKVDLREGNGILGTALLLAIMPSSYPDRVIATALKRTPYGRSCE